MTDTILYSRAGHVGRLVLNIPEKHNSLGREQFAGIQARLSEVAADKDVRVLILSGAGTRTFCAGASLQELSAGGISSDSFHAITEQLTNLAVPTICALNGSVFGGGVELALSCDFRIGVHGLRMRVPAASIGICYPAKGIERIVGILGPSLARRVLISSEEFDAATLLSVGFVDRLVSIEDLEDTASDYAQRLAGHAPLSVQSMKAILQEAVVGAVDFERAKALSALCSESEDLQEGFAAQREKRAPKFNGR
jgi:enoyl-CoA hydratase/carnithine racemase